MLNKIKNNKIQIIELTIIFIITTIFNLICNDPIHDEIWNYGFSYNIATGLIPYKDFNMVITPLFPILGALFISIFGKNLISYYIFNSIICTTIFYYIKKFIPKSYYIIYAVLLFFSLPNYNLFCLLLLYILMSLEDKKSNDILIGIILGLVFLSKQTIGICLFIPTLFQKDIKKIIKRAIGFIIPNIFLLIYLIYHNCLYEFIDYVFLGIGNFAENNINSYISCLIILISSITYLIYKYIKTKDIKLIYILCFQCVAFPIIDPYHVMIPFIPTFTYFLKTLNLNKKIITIAFIIFITTIFSYNIYLCTTKEYPYPNNTEVYKYRKMNNNVIDSINKTKDYIKRVEGKLFIIDMYAYLLKLETSIEINKYDLLNDGNLGKDGQYKIIEEIDSICQKEQCTFLLNEKELNNRISQYNKDILNYIDKTYKKTDNIAGITVYKN
mgnify:FL=1